MVLSSAVTAWVVRQTSTHGDRNAATIAAILEEDAEYEAALGARRQVNDDASEGNRALRQRLVDADAAVRNAPDDETLYRTLADRERIVREVRMLLGRPPEPPRAPIAPAPGSP